MGPRVGGRGDQRRVRAAALAEAHGRARGRSGARADRRRALLRPPRAARSRRSRAAGRSPARCSPRPSDPAARRRAQAELLLERYGIVTREQVLAEGIPGGFSSLYDQFAALETIGVARRGYFIEGLGGAQFALPGRGRAPARAARRRRRAADRARRHRPGAALRRACSSGRQRERPLARARQAGAYVVLAGAEPVLYVERGGKGLQVLVEPRRPAHRRRARGARRRRPPRPHPRGSRSSASTASRSSAPRRRSALLELGFRAGPRKLTLTA